MDPRDLESIIERNRVMRFQHNNAEHSEQFSEPSPRLGLARWVEQPAHPGRGRQQMPEASIRRLPVHAWGDRCQDRGQQTIGE